MICLIGMASCKKATFITADKNVASISMKGGEDRIVMHSDANDYSVVYAPEWIETSVEDSVLVCKAEPNKTSAQKKGYVIVANGDERLTIRVFQQTLATYLLLAYDTLRINSKGNESVLPVFTDGSDVTVENCPEGVTTEYTYGKLIFRSNGNDGKNKSTKVTVSCDDQSAELLIMEMGNACEKCAGKGKILCPICRGSGVDYCPYRTCDECRGRLYVTCPTCKGTGK